jgi:hypothetical protein
MKRPLLLVSLLLLGCAGGARPADADVVLATLSMDLDPAVPVGRETYECRLFQARGSQGGAVHALRWKPPSGPIVLHHAMMFATAATGLPGPVPCEPMPTPVAVLPLYAPGDETITLAEGVSIVVPTTGESLFVELHVIRVGAGSASASVDLLASETPATRLAGWVDDFATVPAIAPHSVATATASCRFAGPVHVVRSWPHMHRLGARFAGTIVRANGGREAFLEVPAWDFAHQPLYAVDASLGEGDAIETACSWNNPTEATVTAGAFSTDEMCNQGLVVWPRESATCVR